MTAYRHRIISIALLVAAAMPQGGMAFITPIKPTHAVSSSLFASIGVFYGTSTGSTEEAARLISEQFGEDASEPIDVDEIKGSLAAKFAEYDSLIVGTPTWNTGADTERSGRWYIYLGAFVLTLSLVRSDIPNEMHMVISRNFQVRDGTRFTILKWRWVIALFHLLASIRLFDIYNFVIHII